MNIKLYSHYDNFTWTKTPKLLHWNAEPYFWTCYEDEGIFLNPVKEPHSFALLIEPRVICPKAYDYVSKHWNQFEYVFTHDDILLDTLPNAKPMPFGGVWGDFSDIHKTKNISILASQKRMCDLHIKRLELAKQLDKTGLVDCYGTWKGEYTSTYDAHAPYRFAIAIENYIDRYWFTEKICNCFANKCIPIYYGATHINEFFDMNGVIQVQSLDEIPEIIKSLDCETEYEKRLDAINNNFEIVKNFVCFEDSFIRMYGDMLKEKANVSEEK